ncbi:ribonuclease BN [Haloplanus litoreus]|uniref:Ribonuclease BN n=1 Tax=Haloplanus litoreus TaxID=767515 RepID=A0ABD6A1V3_9EURY
MTSLGEVYHGDDRSGPSLRQIYAGASLFVVGIALVVAGIVVATTDVLLGGGTTLLDVREYGGILAGLGVPAVFLGISAVLPAERSTRAAAGIGASVAVLGVALFAHAYPCRWSGANCAPGMVDLTLPTAGVYFLGALTTFWCLFVGIANFKTRNDPGGTVTMEVTRQGETKVIEVDRSTARGGVGLGGSASGPTPTVGAQVSDGGADDDDIREVASVSSSEGGATGAETTGPQSPSTPSVGDTAETWKSTAATDAATDAADRYCGNCEHFEYVRTERGIQPYCGFHDGVMADMDACEDWTGR